MSVFGPASAIARCAKRGPASVCVRNADLRQRKRKDMATYHIKGGYARAAKLTPKRRKAIARKAARARWAKVEVKKQEAA